MGRPGSARFPLGAPLPGKIEACSALSSARGHPVSAFGFDVDGMLLTTAHDPPGKEVAETVGVVVANVSAGRHVGKDLLATLRNFFGGRSRSWENTLDETQKQALKEIAREAYERDADGVVAIEIHDEPLDAGMVNVRAVGTAVRLVDAQLG